MPVTAVLTGESDQEGLQSSTSGSVAEGWAKDLPEYRSPSPTLLPLCGLFGKMTWTPAEENIHHTGNRSMTQ